MKISRFLNTDIFQIKIKKQNAEKVIPKKKNVIDALRKGVNDILKKKKKRIITNACFFSVSTFMRN